MKKIIFIITLVLSIFITTNVNAKEVKFYEGEYIDGIWLNKVTPDRKTIYYQKARFFRETSTNEFAYCIEPFSFFYDTENYNPSNTPNNLSNDQINKISLVAHFGYNYLNHYDVKWYAITQLMIWKIAEPNGDYYFTQGLNGNRINIFQDEINEIENLIKNYETLPSFNNQKFYTTLGEKLLITDYNNILKEYKSTQKEVSIKDNTLIIENLPIGNHIIILERENNIYNKPILFYNSPSSQNLVETGNLNKKTIKLEINIQETKLTLEKIDSDQKAPINSGEAKLEGAIYELYDKDMNLITSLEINDNCTAEITNLKYQKYYLKEIKAGTGYEVDNNIYEFELTKDNPKISLELENQVIKAKILINKVYKAETGLINEKNSAFEIYDSKNNLIKTIITDDDGNAEITLPFGTYTIKQTTSQPGYEILKPFEISIKNKDDQTYSLINYKIEVPDTGLYNKKNKILNLITRLLLIILC